MQTGCSIHDDEPQRPSKTKGAEQQTAPGKKPHRQPASASLAQPIRAANEDDDGYDPYTDLHDRSLPDPLFERDPWS
jgi:hypothetical protein